MAGALPSETATACRSPAPDRITVPPEKLLEIADLYRRGLFVQAYQKAMAIGPLEHWDDPDARLLAARLAGQLGSDQRRSAWIWKLHRRFPRYQEALPYFATVLHQKFGPWRAWNWMEQQGDLTIAASPDAQAYWFCVKADIMATVRDFDRAERYLNQAATIDPDCLWVFVTRAGHRIAEDRYDEAMDIVRQLLAVRPWYVPAIGILITLLIYKQQDEEAWRVARDAEQHVECYYITQQRASIEWEAKRWTDLAETLNLLERLAPLADRPLREWLSAMRFDMNYHRGNYEDAIRHGEGICNDFVKTCIARLSDPKRSGRKRIELPVGFVRQHHVTCGPATLAAISNYWQMPVDHLKIAEQICYDGTSHYHERHWAESHGWYVREFSVTEEAAEALLERGVPFTLTTTEPNSAHLQAVIGYDGRLGTLQIRDPYYRPTGDALADKLICHYYPLGPRGMALVPMREKHRLEDLSLPDWQVWELLHQLDGALEHYDRAAAEQIMQRLKQVAPGHRLTRLAELRVAGYDGNPLAAIPALESLCNEFPDSAFLHARKYQILSSIQPRSARIAQLRQLCRGPQSHPMFWQFLAEELLVTADGYDEAYRILRKLARRTIDATVYYRLASWYATNHQLEKGLELYRWAACLDDKNEEYARSYFASACLLNRVSEVLEFLTRRFERYGRKSSWPARSLISAYQCLDRAEEAEAVLRHALELRPDDGPLLLFAARFRQAWGQEYRHEVESYLQRASTRAPRDEYLRVIASLAEDEGRLGVALAHWQELLSAQPLAEDAYRAVARLLAAIQGPQATHQFLESAVSRYPHFQPLHQLWIEWTRDEPEPQREALLRRLLALAPDDGWLRAELAACLAAQRQWEAAWREIEQAEQFNPRLQLLPRVKAKILQGQGLTEQARMELRRAIMAGVDNDAAIYELVCSHDSSTGRYQELQFLFEQLRRQVVTGESAATYFLLAQSVLEPQEYTQQLAEAAHARPDLWQIGLCVVRDHLYQSRLDEADRASRELTERFPLIPALWLERAEVARLRGDEEGERLAIQTAYRLNANWARAVMAWSEFHLRRGDRAESFRILEQAALRCPLDTDIQLAWAEALWQAGRHHEAIQRTLQVVRREPAKENAWNTLQTWCQAMGCPQTVLEEARQVATQRAGEPSSWLRLARLLEKPEHLPERLDAIEKALHLAPRDAEAHCLKIETLAAAGRWPEAEAACHPTVFGDDLPLPLRRQRAVLKYAQGDYAAAMHLLTELVEQEPRDPLSWYYLQQCGISSGDYQRAVSAAEKLVTLYPLSETALTELGIAYYHAGRNEDALQCFERAWSLAPHEVRAAQWSVRLLLAADRIEEAGQRLRAIEPLDSNHLAAAEYIDWAARTGSHSSAVAKFRALLETVDADAEVVQRSVEAMNRAGWQKDCCRLLEEALFRSQGPASTKAHIAPRWAQQKVLCRQWDAERKLMDLLEHGEVGTVALHNYVSALTQPFRPWRLRWFLLRFQRPLARSTEGWACVLYVLLVLGESRRAMRWAQRWHEMSNLQPWMLTNVATACYLNNRFREAAEALRHATTLAPDTTTPEIYLRLSAHCLWNDELDQAQDYLRYAYPISQEDSTQFLSQLIKLMLQAAEAPTDPASRKAVFAQIWQRLRETRRQCKKYRQHAELKCIYGKTIRYLRKRDGSLLGWLRSVYALLYS